MKKLILLVKKVFFSIVLLYCINLVVYSCNVVIPINLFSVSILSILGTFGLISLLVIYFII